MVALTESPALNMVQLESKLREECILKLEKDYKLRLVKYDLDLAK